MLFRFIEPQATTCEGTTTRVRFAGNLFTADKVHIGACRDACGVEFQRNSHSPDSLAWDCSNHDDAIIAFAPHQPKDYLLTKAPFAGFDFQKTNDTIQHAGRSHPVIMPPKVPPTFPVAEFKP
jgi:hypothetical protein